MLDEMITGKVPFDGSSNLEILAKQANEQPMAPKKTAPHIVIDRQVEAVVMRTLEKHPDDRI